MGLCRESKKLKEQAMYYRDLVLEIFRRMIEINNYLYLASTYGYVHEADPVCFFKRGRHYEPATVIPTPRHRGLIASNCLPIVSWLAE